MPRTRGAAPPAPRSRSPWLAASDVAADTVAVQVEDGKVLAGPAHPAPTGVELGDEALLLGRAPTAPADWPAHDAFPRDIADDGV